VIVTVRHTPRPVSLVMAFLCRVDPRAAIPPIEMVDS
jgi:hypothetical protein